MSLARGTGRGIVRADRGGDAGTGAPRFKGIRLSSSVAGVGSRFKARFGLAWNILVAVLGGLASLAAFGVGLFGHIRAGLDPSWVAAVAEAPDRGEIFGRDLIFTGGPLSAAFTHYFTPGTWQWVVLFEAAAVCLVFAALLGIQPGFLGGVAFATAFLMANNNVALLALPLLASLAAARAPRFGRTILVFGAFVSAAASLAKFTVFPVSAATIFLADCVFVSRRRVPVGTVAFLLGFGVLVSLLNGGPSSIVGFVRWSLETSTGYVDAMSLAGSWLELPAYLATAAALMAAVAWTVILRARSWTVREAAAVLSLAIFLFFTFKLGFVRHDLHSISAWHALSVAAALTLCIAASLSSRWVQAGLVLAVPIGGAVAYGLLSEALGLSVAQLARRDAGQFIDSVQALQQIAFSRREWLDRQMAEREAARAAVRAQTPLPPLQGTVDIIPSDQAGVIANGLDYRPRFTVQEYTSYTPDLVEANRAFFRSERAPAHVLFGTASVDARPPAMTEGALWPDLLRLYRPVRTVGDLLLMDRRPQALDELLAAPAARRGRLGERIELGTSRAFLKLTVEKNLLGRLMGALWRPPMLRIRMVFADGREQVYRFVPDQAEAGFIASPFIASAKDFLTFWAGGDELDLLPVVRAVSVEADFLSRFAYGQDVGASVQAIGLAPVLTADGSSPLLAESRETAGDLVLLTRRFTPDPPLLDFAPEGVFAHAPSRISVPAPSGSRLTVGFGIRPSEGTKQADGVCFRVLGEGDAVLWERCLDPGRSEADAGTQTASFALPAGTQTLKFETDCRASCDYDRSYWSKAVIAVAK